MWCSGREEKARNRRNRIYERANQRFLLFIDFYSFLALQFQIQINLFNHNFVKKTVQVGQSNKGQESEKRNVQTDYRPVQISQAI